MKEIDYLNTETADAIPEAASMIETFRAIGYSLETAVADIIDNSITAGATEITIQRIWRGCDSIITIKDDGSGMESSEIIQAMRPGAQNPLQERSITDLGRFGLGLKTASFSQCRKLTVISKKTDSKISFWTWDLDYVAQVKKWKLLKWAPKDHLNDLDDVESGTVVIWSDLDRVVATGISESDENAKMKFSNALERVRKHLAMTFHRFIEEKSINIIWGSNPLEPWNPFCPNENKRQVQPIEYLPGNVSMQGYVLPHKTNFSSESAYNQAEGPNGWGAQQGFYVYRGKRLLLAGDWLGMFRKEEHYKLVRIRIDINNSVDAEWQIDIKKSKAYPPINCRERIEAYAKKIRSMGEEVFRHRGKILRLHAGQEFQPLWLDKKKDNTWTYVVNRDHLMVKDLKDMARQEPDKAIELLLKFIESNIPVKSIYIHESQEEDNTSRDHTDIDAVKQTIRFMYDSLISQGKSELQAKSLLKTIEPFNNHEDLIAKL